MAIGLLVLGFAIWMIAICLNFYTSYKGKITAASIVTGVASLFLVLGLYFIGLGIKPGKDLKDFLIQNKDSLGDIGNTFLGIAITVFVLDALNKRRQEEERKQEIFEEMDSPVRDVAVEAVRLVRKYGWLDEALKKVLRLNAQLAGADFSRAHLQKVILPGADLQGAILAHANLQSANLMGANLQRANLMDANLQEAFLLGANLQKASLHGANLHGAHLQQAKLQEAHLQRANLQEANLEHANLLGSLYDKNTVWPEGFSPEAAGAVLFKW